MKNFITLTAFFIPLCAAHAVERKPNILLILLRREALCRNAVSGTGG